MRRNRYDQSEKPPEPKSAAEVLYRTASLSAQCKYFLYQLAPRGDGHVGMTLDADDHARLRTLLVRCATELRGRAK